ncbi:MAG TPA: AAA family ATPase, partial [Streptosporangiaceae bacterium]|nr:AAA family ATPase [Streptosporangiaceae bacterium]
MLGRDRELRVVGDLLRGAEAGHGGMLLVEGEPGVGKTSLLRQSSAVAAERGFSLAWRTPDQLPQLVPTAQAVPMPPQSPAVAAVGDAGKPGNGDPRRSGPDRRWPRAERAAQNQLMIMMDDLQWADPATLRALRSLSLRPRAQSPLWVLARSAVSVDNDAEWLFDHLERSGAVRMMLRPLDDKTMAEMAADTLGAALDRRLLALVAEAGGNPLLLAELLAGLADEGGIRIDGGLACLVSGRLPQRLQTAVRRWLSELSPRARQIVEVGAVLGKSFRVGNIAALLGETAATLLPELEAALEAGILAATPSALAFRHDLVWRAVAEGVPAPARQALHLQAGELLLDRGGPADDAAAHLISGTSADDAHAIARLDRAARAFLPSAPQTAADLTLRALELAGRADRGRFDRTVTAAEALAAAG